MDCSVLKDCRSQYQESSYLDIPEFVTDIKQEICAEDSKSADSVHSKEHVSSVEEHFSTDQYFPADHVKTEPIEEPNILGEGKIIEEPFDLQDKTANVSSGNSKPAKDLLGNPIFNCDKCNYETCNKNYLDKHIMFAKHILHECLVCGYKTPKLANFKRHVLSHEPKEGYIHKCLDCQFQTTDEFAIYKHMAEHPNANSPVPKICQHCDVGSFDNIFGNEIFQNNKTGEASEIKECYYQTCQKDDKVHVFSDEIIKVVKIYKCSECKYQTKRKENLAQHMLRHKDRTELEMFACIQCSYQSFSKSHLQTHLLTHKSGEEVTLYRCTECEYHSKYKADLRVHILRHRNRSEVTMFKCAECAYKAIRKCDLNRHLLRHKSAQEVKMHLCPQCKYETFDKGNLNKHIYRHKLADKGLSK